MFEAVFGGRELKRMKAQLAAGVRNMVADGRVPSKVSMGYLRHRTLKGVHVIAPERAEWVLYAFRQRAAGVQPIVIARHLSENRVPEPSEFQKIDREKLNEASCRCQWSPWMVNCLFDNAIYMGCITYAKKEAIRDPATNLIVGYRRRPRDQWVENYNAKLEIVPPYLWQMVFAIRKGIGDALGVRVAHHGQYALTGLYRCGCGSKLEATSNSWLTPCVRCLTASTLPDRCCGVGVHETSVLEKQVFRHLAERVLGPDQITQYRAEYASGAAMAANELNRKRQRLEADIEHHQNALDYSFDHKTMAGFDIAEAAYQRQRATAAKNKALKDLSDLKASAKSLVGLAKLDTLAGALQMMIDSTPFRPETAEGRILVGSIRSLVRSVKVEAPLEDGTVWIEIDTDVAKLVGVAGSEWPLFPLQSVHRVSYNILETNAAASAKAAAKRSADLAAIADNGEHDLSDEAWEAISAEAGKGRFDDVGGPRLLFNGLMFLMKTGKRLPEIPSRFGEPDLFRKAFKRLVWCHGWDRCLEILKADFPDEIARADTTRWNGTNYRRSTALAVKPYAGMTSAEIRSLSVAAKQPLLKFRLEVVAQTREPNIVHWQVAARNRIAPVTVAKWSSIFSAVGPSGLEASHWRGGAPARLTPEEARQLKPLLEAGINPYDPGAPIGLSTLKLHVSKVFSKNVSGNAIWAALKKEGLGVRKAAQQRALANAKIAVPDFRKAS
ncbi:recombinase family protein [Beijerinckia sp. L45]|uniref:recombinase family protein n=1 Tax=Beijerinckia sp. L45 TaxID=1641855 RepID=UPI001FEE8E69|nr:recombinase family protein [Beijerinckia sp. L45]